MTTQTSGTTTAVADFDLLQHIGVRLPCTTCGEYYDVSFRQVQLSQELLHLGCPESSDAEWSTVTYAALANEAALHEFERSWTRLARQVRAMGLQVTVRRPLLGH